MHLRLVEILEEKKHEVEKLKKTGLPAGSEMEKFDIRDFKAAISLEERAALIAEIKFASPSAGTIREHSDVPLLGRTYEEAGADAISLITDRKFFGGTLHHLLPLKKEVSIPILRKDFIIHEMQVRESRLYGADAILLIARILTEQQLRGLLAASNELGLAVLTEIHDTADLEKAVLCGAEILGINNRDLDTFEVDIKTTLKLAPLVPRECVLVSESGIMNGEDVRLLRGSGIQAVLVGTSIMKSSNVLEKVKELAEAGKDEKHKS